MGKGHSQEHQQNWHPYIQEDKVTVERYNCREVWLTLNSLLDLLTFLGSYRSQSPHMHWTEHNLLSKVWRNQFWARQVCSFSEQWQKWAWGGGRRGVKRGDSRAAILNLWVETPHNPFIGATDPTSCVSDIYNSSKSYEKQWNNLMVGGSP